MEKDKDTGTAAPSAPASAPQGNPEPGLWECMDRAFLTENFIAWHLLEHQVIQENPTYRALATVAHQAIFELYQRLGAENHGTDPDELDSVAVKLDPLVVEWAAKVVVMAGKRTAAAKA